MRRALLPLLVLPLLSCSLSTEQVADLLDGQRWEMPCQGDGPDDAHCEAPDGVDRAIEVDATTGATSTTFVTTVRVRGVVEPKTVEDADYTDGPWAEGGDPAGDEASVFALEVSDPDRVHHLNAGASPGAHAMAVDVEVTLDIAPGATVRLVADDGGDGLQLRNLGADGDPLVIEGVEPDPDPYDGQFLQIDVLEVIEQ